MNFASLFLCVYLRECQSGLLLCSGKCMLWGAWIHSQLKARAPSNPLPKASTHNQLWASISLNLISEKKLQHWNCTGRGNGELNSFTCGISCRQVNRAVLADSPILWRLFYSNISSSLLPLQTLEQQLGPKAEQMKLWDLPLAHIIVNPGQYKTRRSGWLHLHGGHSFCMEAVHTSNEAGQGEAWIPAWKCCTAEQPCL